VFFPNSGNNKSPWPAAIPRALGRPVRIEFRRTVRDEAGDAAHAATFLRQRRMVFEESLMADGDDFARIFVHELFHFVWLRLGNAKRRSYERAITKELRQRVRGELGWSAEWRKKKLEPRDWRERTRRWREYCCESFCDTAAWRYAGVKRHTEFTLASAARAARRDWFARAGVDEGIAI
jgi:hypothetical protein